MRAAKHPYALDVVFVMLAALVAPGTIASAHALPDSVVFPTGAFNVVTDVLGTRVLGVVKGQAVWIQQFPGGVTGTVTIANNVVERVDAERSYGFTLLTFGAAAKIVGNVIRDARDTAILVVAASQPVWIEDNLIVPGDEPYDPAFFSPGNGIAAGQGSGPVYIRRNTVVCRNPWADGIALNGHLVFPPAPYLAARSWNITM